MQAAVTAGTGRATLAAGKLRCRPLKQCGVLPRLGPGGAVEVEAGVLERVVLVEQLGAERADPLGVSS